MAFFDTGDGRNLFLPDDITEEEIQERINAYISKFPLPTVKEETVATTPITDEIDKPVEDTLIESTILNPLTINTFDEELELEINKNIESTKANRQNALDIGQSSFAYDKKLTELEKRLKQNRLKGKSTYADIAPNLRPEESYDEGDPALFSTDLSLSENLSGDSQVVGGAMSSLIAQIEVFKGTASVSNIAELSNFLDSLKVNLKAYEDKGLDNLNPEETKEYQEIYNEVYGVGVKPVSEYTISDYYGQMGFGGDSPLGQRYAVDQQRKKEQGLESYINEQTQTLSSLTKKSNEIEVSDAFKWVMEEGMGDDQNDPRAWDAFYNDLNLSQKGDFLGDVLGRSAAATSAILGTSFGLAGLTKSLGWLGKFATQFLGVGGVSGEIEYSHSFLEYLKAKGMDVNDSKSIQKFINNKELLQEAKDYSLKRGAIIGSVDGLTGGIATKIIAPSVITRANRSVLPYIKKPVGTSVNPSTRHAVNFSAQTPLQTGLPAGAEYFAQLATLEEGEKISMGEVLAEAMGEAVFVPADMVLGAYSARKENLTIKQIKEERFNSVVEYLQITKEQGRQLGLEDLAGEIAVGEDQTIYDTGIPYFNEAFDIYQQNANKISLTANTDANIIAPNQFFVEPDGQGKFLILDTYNEKFGNIYDSQEEAAGISGSLNAISGASYSTELKNQYATMQGLNSDSLLTNKLGNQILNPYFGQIDIEDINQSSNVNSAAYERLINAVGKDATSIDVLSLQGVLPEADINRLLDIKAKKLYQDANVGKNLPSNITIKMFENLGKKLNLNIDTTSNGFKSLALRLTGQPDVNKLSNAQKRLVYSFLNTLPQHEGTVVSLPDFSSRPYTLNEYNQVVDSLNSGNSPTIPNIITALGLNPNDINDKRTATRLRQDLVSAGIVDKKGSKYKFNANGEWSLNRAQQAAIENNPQTKTDLKEIQKFRSLLSEQFKKMGLPEISLKIDNAIQTKVGQINPQAEGQFDPIWSEVFLNVAKAKEGTTSEQEVIENLSTTLGHELFHATKFLDLFSIQEINNLNNFVRNNELNAASAETLLGKDNLKILTDSLGRTPTYLEAIEFRYNTLDNQNLNNEALLEEANALLFEDHINNKRKLAGQPRALMERTKKFFSTVNNGLNELGFQTYEDVFDKLIIGEIGTRERTSKTQQPFEVTRMDEYGRPQGSYEVEPRVVRTNRILENEFSEILRVSETSIGNEYFSESADRESPMFQRPLQDAPNLKFKLGDTQQRPTTLTQEYWRGAQNGEYGNDINQIGEIIFARNIVNNTDIIRRLGRTLENSEIGTTQKQLFEYTQKFLKNAKNYPETFSMYVVGDLNRSTSGTVATNNLEEAENIANEFVNPPFKILGDRKKITEYTVNRPQVMLDKDVMFGAKPPVWAQPSLSSTDYLLIGSSALATSPNQPVSYQERTPPKGVVTRKFNLGTLKPKYSLKGMELLGGKPGRGKQITDNLRTYRKPVYSVGQASLQEKRLNKKLKLSAKENERVIYTPGTFQPKIIKEVGDFKIVKDDYLEGNLNVGKILDVDVELFRDPGGFAGENYSMVITDSRAIGDANVGLYANNLKQAKLEAVNEIEKFATNSVLEDVTGRRLYQTNNKRLYFFEDDPIVINHLEEETFGVKQKLSEPLDDIAFKNAKEDLLELMNQGVDVIELADHPALMEGMSRMAEIQPTSDQYLNKFGEDWFLNKAYINNRKFVINNKSVNGIRKAIAESIKKAESYSNNDVPNNKQAWIVLGATASGKSYYSEILAKENNLAIVDSDDIKKIIPEYKGGVGANAVHTESRLITSEVRRDLMDQGKNMLLPRVGGLSKRKEIQSLIQELKESDYDVKTVFIDTDYKTALERMYKRFAKTGRLVPTSYIEEVKNTPIDTFHRVKYNTDGYAWIDNNGEQNQETIRQDTGILPTDVFGGRGNDVRRILRESSEEASQSFTSEEEVTIEEAIEGVKSLNERLTSAGLVAKFNLNASPDAIRAAYISELRQPDSQVIPNNLKSKHSLKNAGTKLDDKTDALIEKITIRDQFDSAPSMGRIILETASGYASEDAIREQLVDKYARFQTLGVQAAKARGMKEEMLTADISAISALMLSDRSGEVFRSSFVEGVPVYDEKGYVRTETVSSVDGQPVQPPLEFLAPAFENPQLMWAFQAVRIAKREKRFDAEGKPVKTTAQDRKDAVDALKKYPELQEMSDAYDRWDAHVVKFLVDTGVLDVNTAQQWTAHADYFPFYRMIGVDQNGNQLTKGPKIFKGLGLGKNIFVKAKGSADKDIVDPITGIGDNLRAAITLGMKNVAANRVVRDMLDAGFAEQVPLNSTGLNIVKVRIGGKTKAFRVDDVQLYEAFQNFEGGSISFGGVMSRLTAVPKEALSALITRTPDFWIRQVLRDSISAQTILGGNFIPLATSLKNWGKVWAGMIAAKLPYSNIDIIPEGVSKMRRAGVTSGYDTVVRDIDNSQKLIKSAYEQAGIKNRTSVQNIAMQPFDLIKGVWNMLGDGTISSDAATRLAVYEDILKRTGNEAEAVFQAMEVLNFTRKGKNPLMQFLSTVIPFQNPRMQGVDVFYRGATGKYGQAGDSKSLRRRKFALRMGMLASLTPLYFMLVKDTDEYKEASEEMRDNYYILPFTKKLFGQTIGIPIPFEVGIFTKTVPERILRYNNDNETFKEMLSGMARRIGISLAIDPRQATFINAPLENLTNFDFYTGQPVVPYYMKDLDPELQYRPSTNNLWKELGEELGVSALYLDNLWKGYTGTIGNWVANATDSFSREFLDMPDRQAMRTDEKPLVGALTIKPEGRGLENEFYSLKETTDNLFKSMKEMEKRIVEGGDQFAYNLSNEYRFEYMQTLELLSKDLEDISKLLSETRLEETRILNNETITPEEKTKKLTKIQGTRNFILQGIGKRRMKLEEGLFEDIRGAI